MPSGFAQKNRSGVGRVRVGPGWMCTRSRDGFLGHVLTVSGATISRVWGGLRVDADCSAHGGDQVLDFRPRVGSVI